MPFCVFLQACVKQGFKETDVGRFSKIKQFLRFFFEMMHLKANVHTEYYELQPDAETSEAN